MLIPTQKLLTATVLLAAPLLHQRDDYDARGAPVPTPGLSETLDLTFGVYKTDKATDMYRKFTPFMEALQERVSKLLARDVDIQVRIFPTYDDGIDALVDGEVDLVRFGPSSYVLSERRNPKLQLLAVEEVDGKTVFSGLIIARKAGDVEGLGDLRGRSFAFGDRNSTIGRYLAQDLLLGAGIDARSLSRYEYLGRHDKVARAVQEGDFDAGSVKEDTFEKLDQSDLKVVLSFDNVTKPWITRADLAPEIASALRHALLDIRDEEILAAFKVSGFVEAPSSHFDPIRRAMKRAEAFEAEARR